MGNIFLSCDWGTSSFRLRLVDTVTGAILHELVADEGIKVVYEAWLQSGQGPEKRQAFYLSVLSRHIDQLQRNYPSAPGEWPVIISGMASSNIGITALAYKPLPFAIDGHDLALVQLGQTDEFPHQTVIVSGACTASDIMRGEETQLVGCVALSAADNTLFIFPGTHSKHVWVSNGAVTNFKTFMTGEFFALASQYSILSSGIAAAAPVDTSAFEQGVQKGLSENILNALFTVRTNTLFNRLSREANYHYLSGLLIGAELNDFRMDGMQAITLAGESGLTQRYSQALAIAGIHCPVQIIDAATATTQGQLIIYNRLLAG
jgi:2-dehydro-3-deoxygalactonokinase